MEISVTSDKENKLLGRREIRFDASYSGSKTPSRDEMREEICKKLSLNPDMTVVIRISQAYGSNSGEVEVHSYKDKKAMEILARQEAVKEEKKEAPAKAEAKSEEKKEAKEKKAPDGEEKKE